MGGLWLVGWLVHDECWGSGRWAVSWRKIGLVASSLEGVRAGGGDEIEKALCEEAV